MSRKQYYARMQRLVALELVKRTKDRKYSLSVLGRAIYRSYEIVEMCADNYMKLKAVDILEDTLGLDDIVTKEELKRIIETLITKKEIRHSYSRYLKLDFAECIFIDFISRPRDSTRLVWDDLVEKKCPEIRKANS